MTSVEKLISIASGPLNPQTPELPIHDFGPMEGLAAELLSMLVERNGFYAFEGALHVFPSHGHGAETGLLEWNKPELWRAEYGQAADGCIFFAEDLFGGQFCITEDGICSFDPETGMREFLAHDIDDWAAAILQDYEVMTAQPLAHVWQVENGKLPSGHRLAPKMPFVAGGSYSTDNLFLVDAVSGMRMRADIARQIAGLPDGAKIKISVVD